MPFAMLNWTPAEVALLIAGIPVYMLPAIIAYVRNHPNRVGILIVNVTFGWTILAWPALLFWACTKPKAAV